MYTYLTGSASWYMLTLVSEVFGVVGFWGTWCWNRNLFGDNSIRKAHARLVVHFAERNWILFIKTTRGWNMALIGFPRSFG